MKTEGPSVLLSKDGNGVVLSSISGHFAVNISKQEQRTLHALAQGGHITLFKNERRKPQDVECKTREGWFLTDCTLPVFLKLRKRRFIASKDGSPYRITRAGLEAVRAQLDNR